MKRKFAECIAFLETGIKMFALCVVVPGATGLLSYGVALAVLEIQRYLTEPDALYGMIELIVCAVGAGLVLGSITAGAVILRRRSFSRKIANRRRRCLGYIDADAVCRMMRREK